MPGWLVVMHTYLYYFPLSLYGFVPQQHSNRASVDWKPANTYTVCIMDAGMPHIRTHYAYSL